MATLHLLNGESIQLDDDLLPALSTRSWGVNTAGTVQHAYWDKAARRSRSVLLNAFIMGAPKRGYLWQHADGDRRNFRRDNLVQVKRGHHHPRAFGSMDAETRREIAARRSPDAPRDNARPNATRYRGVHAAGNQFRAMATVSGKQTYLGLFKTPEDAARAYDKALTDQGIPPVNFRHS